MKPTLKSLRQDAHHILRLPPPAQQVVDAYLHLRVDGATAPCPYHINPGLRSTNRALLGKGSPTEIEAFAAKYFQQQAMDPSGDPQKLRSLMLSCGLGVDCSGFASWVLNAITLATLGRPIWKCLTSPGMRHRLTSKIRPIENISANLLTGPLNAQPVLDLSHVKPGDLIRVAGWHHVIVITEAGLDATGHARYFTYAQSSCMYGTESGVRTGHTLIEQPQGPLLAQTWHDNYESSVIENLIKEDLTDSRIVRLKALS